MACALHLPPGPGLCGLVSQLDFQLLLLLQLCHRCPCIRFGSEPAAPRPAWGHGTGFWEGVLTGLPGWCLGSCAPAGPGPVHWDLPEGAVAAQGIVLGDGTLTWARGAVLREGPSPQHPEQTQGQEEAGSLHLLAGETTETLASHMQLIVRHLFHGRERGEEGLGRGCRGARAT